MPTLVAFLLLSAVAAAQPVLPLSGPEPDLAGHLVALVDPTGALSVDDAAESEAYRPVAPVLGRPALAAPAVWLRLTLQAPADAPSAWALETKAERIDVYWAGAGGRRQHRVAGIDVPAAERDLDQGFPGTVLLTLAAGERRTLHVRVAHDPYGSEATPHLRPIRIVRAADATLRGRSLALWNGLFFGALLALALFNLAMLVALRDASFLYYVGYVGGIGLYFLTVYRYGFDAFWPADLGWSPVVQTVALHVGLACFPLFVRAFLGPERVGPRLDRALLALAAAVAAGLVVTPALGWRAGSLWMSGLVLALIAVTVAAMWRGWRSGYAPSALLLASFAVLAGSTAGFVAPQFGAPPVDWAMEAVQAGLAFEALLLAVALAWRVARLRTLRAEASSALAASEMQRQQAEAAAATLEEAVQLRSNLLGFAAHDLRTPLANVLGLADLVAAATRSAKVTDHAHHIGREARRLLRLIDDLLVTAALDGGHLPVVLEPLDLGALVDAATQPFAPRARAKGQTLAVRAPRGHLARLDVDRFTEVVDNLVSNAVKYTPRGGTVEVDVRGTDDEVWMCVGDSGPGVPVEDQARMFEPFARLAATPTAGEPSTGLGLSIVQQIVALHHGRVDVDSAPGRGTRITVVLPAASVEPGGDGSTAQVEVPQP
ncbi:7TM diverse intracellular signaling domain-containing protein [Rubrivirga sp. IMCC45206]|uniref:sensor histidine kinase n=1 Tax=Rubrivirga sp. IMCC45206 TaxID=3391614 RepID=UPI00398FFC62